jgi:hypothetical protein
MEKFKIKEEIQTETVKRYTVVWPDGILDGTSFKEKFDAQTYLRALEEAYRQGYKQGEKEYLSKVADRE